MVADCAVIIGVVGGAHALVTWASQCADSMCRGDLQLTRRILRE